MGITCILFRAVDARRLFTCVASITHAPDIALLICHDPFRLPLARAFVQKDKNEAFACEIVAAVRFDQTNANRCTTLFPDSFFASNSKKKMKNGEETRGGDKRTLRDVQYKRPP